MSSITSQFIELDSLFCEKWFVHKLKIINWYSILIFHINFKYFTEEIITKRTTELTTTKQIETRVKRQVKFEDGKVVEDSGPEISTNTTQDTDKVESEQTEVSLPKMLFKYQAPPFSLIFIQQRKTFGEPDEIDGPQAVEFSARAALKESSPIKVTKLVSAPREDGLVREEKENRVVSREDKIELTEVEDVHHFGDFSDAVSLILVHIQI